MKIAIDATVLGSVADLANIKKRTRRNFFRSVRAAIIVAIEPNYSSGDDVKAVYQAPITDQLRKWREAVATLKGMMNSDRRDTVFSHAQGHIRSFLSRRRRGALWEFEQSWALSLDDVGWAISKATELVQEKYQKTGRPPGAQGNVATAVFVKSVIHAAEANGGHLTISRGADGGHGTLIEAINLLRPYLPRGFLPPAGSVRFYEIASKEVVASLKTRSKLWRKPQ